MAEAAVHDGGEAGAVGALGLPVQHEGAGAGEPQGAIVVAARNPVMELLNDAITHLLVGMGEQTCHVPGAVAQSLEDHHWVRDAIAAHDPDRARVVMTGVLDQVEGRSGSSMGRKKGPMVAPANSAAWSSWTGCAESADRTIRSRVPYFPQVLPLRPMRRRA